MAIPPSDDISLKTNIPWYPEEYLENKGNHRLCHVVIHVLIQRSAIAPWRNILPRWTPIGLKFREKRDPRSHFSKTDIDFIYKNNRNN